MTCTESTIDWETEVAGLLDELMRIEEELLDMLARKQGQLGAGDPATRPEIRVRERRLAAQLAQCQARRADLLAAKGKEATGNYGKLAQVRTKQLRRPIQLLRSDNIPNWVQAQRALLQVAQLVETAARISASRA